VQFVPSALRLAVDRRRADPGGQPPPPRSTLEGPGDTLYKSS